MQSDYTMQVPGMSHTQILFLHLQCVLPMVDGRPGEHHGVVVGPLGRVPPALLVAVPEMATGRISHNPLWETLPHRKGEVDLRRDTERIS